MYKVWSEVGRVSLLVVVEVLVVAVLWSVPYALVFALLIPAALAAWFWPHSSTVLSYLVGALVGTLFSAWSWIGVVEQPAAPVLWFLWLPLVWGPAGVVVKRLEVLFMHVLHRRKEYHLPELR